MSTHSVLTQYHNHTGKYSLHTTKILVSTHSILTPYHNYTRVTGIPPGGESSCSDSALSETSRRSPNLCSKVKPLHKGCCFLCPFSFAINGRYSRPNSRSYRVGTCPTTRQGAIPQALQPFHMHDPRQFSRVGGQTPGPSPMIRPFVSPTHPVKLFESRRHVASTRPANVRDPRPMTDTPGANRTQVSTGSTFVLNFPLVLLHYLGPHSRSASPAVDPGLG